MELKTIDSILEDIEQRVKENQPVSPQNWLDAAQKLNALKGDLDNEIADFEFKLLKIEAGYIQDGETSAKAKTLAKIDTEYNIFLKAKAKSLRIIEAIRISKLQARQEY